MAASATVRSAPLISRFLRPLALAAMACLSLPLVAAAADGELKNPRAGYDQFIVKFKPGSAPVSSAKARQQVLDAGAKSRGLAARHERRMGIGADVVSLNGRLDERGAQAFMNRLRRDPSVEWVEIDRVLKAHFVPNDSFYANNHWHYFEPTGGIGMPTAWDLAPQRGSGVVVAVLDTGITTHSDLAANIVPGYDFITHIWRSNDLNGRDSDPSDPGDFVAIDECGDGPAEAEDSSWHGTHVAGTVAAVTNNSKGVAGIAFNAKVMPVRVLGKCGGLSSDIADAIMWAAGGAVTGVPANANPVEVINMSLGGEGACGAATQAAINYAVGQNVTVVVSAGNEDDDSANYEPANCQNVITVGATNRQGGKSGFSNWGTYVDVSAPGGGEGSYIASTYNTGETAPVAEGYIGMGGTSMSAPHVSGLVALMQAEQASTPAQVEALLKSTARALPLPCAQGCGAGIINAPAAVGSLGAGALLVSDAVVSEGNSGTKQMTFTVSLTKAIGGAVTFNVATSDGTATAGSDYVALAMNGQSIPAGQTSKTFNVTINGDTAPEANETFNFNVSNVTGIPVADAQAVGVINDEDPVMLSSGVAVPGLAGTLGQARLFAINVPAGRTSLQVTLAGGSAGQDADLYVNHGSVPDGNTDDCISEESDSSELCDIANPQAGTWYVVVYGFTAYGNVTLTATYQPVASTTFSVGDASVSEGNAGTKTLGFAVSLSAAAASDVTFNIATSDGTGFAGSDYVGKSSQGVVIAAGQTSATFNVTINGDATIEDHETFVVTASNVAGGGVTVLDAQGLGRIANDDLASLRIIDAAVGEGNAGTSTATFEIQLSQPQPTPVTFDIATSGGTAASGSDFVARTQTGRFLDAGRTRAVFEVQINGDAVSEANETFSVTISNVSGATLSDGAGVGTIVNDDGGAPAAGGGTTYVLAGAPLLLDFDGTPIEDSRACRDPAQKRTARTARLPTCTYATGLPAGAKRTPTR
jgi:serine protease